MTSAATVYAQRTVEWLREHSPEAHPDRGSIRFTIGYLTYPWGEAPALFAEWTEARGSHRKSIPLTNEDSGPELDAGLEALIRELLGEVTP
jgi:hypothetical protein